MNQSLLPRSYRKLFVSFRGLIVLILLWLSIPLSAQKHFYWKWQLVDDSLQITGSLNGTHVTTLKVSASPIKESFKDIYRTVDLLEYQDANAYQTTVRMLSDILVKPFEKQITGSETIVVTIDSALLYFPLEFLQVGKTAIALVRPLVFQLQEGNYKKTELVKLKKGLIIRDPSSDPEDACATTFSRYPTSTYKSAYRVSPANLRQGKNDDFLLISTHGFVDTLTSAGRILLKDSVLPPSFFSDNHFKVVYLDACQQGINWSYLSLLSSAAEPSFYLGPIVSNDSGESSTKTINWFFSEMKRNGGDPVVAIWKTRNRLFKHYSKRNWLDVVNKAFIFRIYKM